MALHLACLHCLAHSWLTQRGWYTGGCCGIAGNWSIFWCFKRPQPSQVVEGLTQQVFGKRPLLTNRILSTGLIFPKLIRNSRLQPRGATWVDPRHQGSWGNSRDSLHRIRGFVNLGPESQGISWDLSSSWWCARPLKSITCGSCSLQLGDFWRAFPAPEASECSKLRFDCNNGS